MALGMMFNRITSEQVSSVHKVYNLLRKMKVIGVVSTITETVRLTDFGKPFRYNLKYVDYDPTMKGKLTADEEMEQYFKSLRLVFDG